MKSRYVNNSCITSVAWHQQQQQQQLIELCITFMEINSEYIEEKNCYTIREKRYSGMLHRMGKRSVGRQRSFGK